MFVGLRFQRASKPMDVIEDKEGDEGGIERERYRAGLRERERQKEKETHSSA